ncbi:MAG: ABC transporter permease [Solirubrobacterales bacterium]
MTVSSENAVSATSSPAGSSSWSLIWRLARRQVEIRYRDSMIGLAWAVLGPLILVALYSIVFSTVLEGKWFVRPGDERFFALALYSGLVFFLLFSEVLNSAVGVVQSNATLIKRTTIRPEILPVASALAALVSFGFSLVPLVALYLVVEGIPPAATLLYPLVVGVLWLLVTGASFLLAALAPYFRDIQQLMPLITTAYLFLSPIFYPASAVPEALRNILYVVNPLMVIIPSSQDLIFLGEIPPLLPLAIWALVGVAFFLVGIRVFRKAARGFADVI